MTVIMEKRIIITRELMLHKMYFMLSNETNMYSNCSLSLRWLPNLLSSSLLVLSHGCIIRTVYGKGVIRHPTILFKEI